MNRLEYLAHHGSPGEIIEEVTADISALQKVILKLREENAALEERVVALSSVINEVY
jgi:hypothetical protein